MQHDVIRHDIQTQRRQEVGNATPTSGVATQLTNVIGDVEPLPPGHGLPRNRKGETPLAEWRVAVDQHMDATSRGMDRLERKLDLMMEMQASLIRAGKGKENMLPYDPATPHVSAEPQKMMENIHDREWTHSINGQPFGTENTTSNCGPSYRSGEDGPLTIGTASGLHLTYAHPDDYLCFPH